MNGGKTEYLAVLHPVPGLPEARQRELLEKFQPTEWLVITKDLDWDRIAKLVRPPRVVLIAYAGLMADDRGNKLSRVESMIATKVAIHKRGGYVVEATGRRSDKSWPAMKRDGEEMCRRLAQGAKSALNARRGAEPFDFTDKQLAMFLSIMREPGNDDRRLAKIKAYCKAQKVQAPKRTWLKTKLHFMARSRGLTD